jgi:hypothetical protein
MKIIDKSITEWLLKGDISIQCQVHRDILRSSEALINKLQKRIETEGWGSLFLGAQNENGHWGRGFYQPKWTSTHYTLMDLKNIGLPKNNRKIHKSIKMIFDQAFCNDGGINYSKTLLHSDVCINGMVLGFASYFNVQGETVVSKIVSLVDSLLATQMDDGGWNCEYIHGASHSSMHTTISVLEGLFEYKNAGGVHRTGEILDAERRAIEFLLEHRLFQSHRTGMIMDKKMLMLSYPSRWRYDILRALDYLRSYGAGYDKRMEDAFKKLLKKRRSDGSWPLQMKHPGQVHFDMEKTGQPSRWNTLRALRVLEHFKINPFEGVNG